MKTSQTLILSKKKYMFHILDSIEAELDVSENPYQLPIEELFTMAARINKKRSFLFVSKVLGKHLPIDPNKGLLTAALLAARFIESVKGSECLERERLISQFLQGGSYNSCPFIPMHINPVIIGFAETATALGHAFFDCFQAADFFHTTREELIGQNPVVTFEEEHSHATSHRCYMPLNMIANDREIILVDDEITTGKTALNIIKSIHARFPRKEYTVVSILDWRSAESVSEFSHLEQMLGIQIHVVSLLAGTIKVEQLRQMVEHTEEKMEKQRTPISIEKVQLAPYFTGTDYKSCNSSCMAPFIKETGRFGLKGVENSRLQQNIGAAAAFVSEKRNGRRTLCLGSGEFMYLPMKIAAAMGKGISYQSTTRSPIYIENREGYGARHGFAFPNPEDHAVTHYVYNITPGDYDELFLFLEREVDSENFRPFLRNLEQIEIKDVKIVFFSE